MPYNRSSRYKTYRHVFLPRAIISLTVLSFSIFRARMEHRHNFEVQHERDPPPPKTEANQLGTVSDRVVVSKGEDSGPAAIRAAGAGALD